jgi:hypothetical protein
VSNVIVETIFQRKLRMNNRKCENYIRRKHGSKYHLMNGRTGKYTRVLSDASKLELCTVPTYIIAKGYVVRVKFK